MKMKLFNLCGVMAATIVAVALLAHAVVVVEAATITVSTTDDVVDGNDGECSLREAVLAANKNAPSGDGAGECPAGSDSETDVITLANNQTYVLSIAGMNENKAATGDLDIVNNTAAVDVRFVVAEDGNATISADGIDRVLHIIEASVELTQVSLIKGQVDELGGNIVNQNGVLVMNGGAIRNGTAMGGGGLFNYGSEPGGGIATLNGTQIILNTALTDGGGIAILQAYGLTTLNEVLIRTNTANQGKGGGIAVGSGTLLIDKSSINLNQAKGPETSNGGGLYVQGPATITITNSTFDSNKTAVGSGGGIYLHPNEDNKKINFTLHDSRIVDNEAGGKGGGLYGHDLKVKNSDFSDNQSHDGGGIYSDSPLLSITGGVFENNVANDKGGAILALNLNATDATFTGNSAYQGGAIHTPIVQLTNVLVENNQATAKGGGLYLWGSAEQEITASRFLSNTAENGGGIYYEAGGKFVKDSMFANNKASNQGGAIFAKENSLEMGNTTISNNSADSGGGIYIAETSAVTATNVTIAFNTPGQDVYKLGDLTLQNSIIHTPDTPNCTVALDNPKIISLGNNLTDDDSCIGLDQPTDINTTGVLLDPLADNGGNTLTHALQAGSPALNAGNPTACAGPLVDGVDQRNIPRLEASCDIGAFEQTFQIFLPSIMR